MAITVYPLNNIDYTAEDVGIYNATRTSGIYANDDFALSLTGSDNTISVDVGLAWMRLSRFFGVAVAVKNKVFVDMGLPDSVYSRIDALVLQFDANKNGADVVVKSGTASSNPQPPALSQTEALYELHLAHVLRKPGSASITVADVTDMRLSTKYCGIMSDPVSKVDTTAIDAQISALIEKLREALSDVEAQQYYASKDYVQEEVSDAFKQANAYASVISARKNCLINSNFRNPVNQLGKTSYTGTGYTIDRWRNSNANSVLNVNNGSIRISATSGNGVLRQYLENEPDQGKKYTFAAKMRGTATLTLCAAYGNITSTKQSSIINLTSDWKVYSFTFDSWNENVALYSLYFRPDAGGYADIEWAALYEGEYKTETLPEYQPKDYATELAECYRHYLALLPSADDYTMFDMVAGWGAILKIDAPSEMRVTPTLKMYSGSKSSIFHPSSGWVEASVSFIRRMGTTYYFNIELPSGYVFNDGVEYLIKNLKALDANIA